MDGIDVIKKGPWSLEEDQKLIAYIQRYGIWNWNRMAAPAGLARSGKSCRLRWMNYLRPNVRHGNFTPKEEEIIIKCQQAHGNKWSMISSKLEGRTDNEVKNYWNTRLKKRFGTDASTQHNCSESRSLVFDAAGMKLEFEVSMNSSTLTNGWMKEEVESNSEDTTSEMCVDSLTDIRGYWDELYPTVGNELESMFMVSSSTGGFIPPYVLQESSALEKYYCINDTLWEH